MACAAGGALHAAQAEVRLVGALAEQFKVSGVLMDAEAGGGFFKGYTEIEDTYARALRETFVLK